MKDFEEALLGAWLSGEHLNDLKYAQVTAFDEKEIIRGLKSGKDMLEIGTAIGDLPRVAKMSTLRSDVLYKQAFAKMMDEQIKQDISAMSDLDLVRGKLEYLESVLAGDEKAEETESPELMFLKEIDERSRRQVIKWEKMATLNNQTAGIKRKELTVVAARPSVGKSAFALQMAYGAYKQGAKVLYFPLEMSTFQTFGRLLIAENYIDSKELQTGQIRNQSRYQKGIDLIKSIHGSGRFKIYEGQGQIEKIESTISAEEPFLVVIDQLTQMRSSVQFRDTRMQFSHMTSNLKRIAMQYDVAVLLLCQINRAADGIKPTMSNLKESGSIEEDADNVILLHRFRPDQLPNSIDPAEFDWVNTKPMNLELAKQRDGETGEFTVVFDPSRMTFYEVQL